MHVSHYGTNKHEAMANLKLTMSYFLTIYWTAVHCLAIVSPILNLIVMLASCLEGTCLCKSDLQLVHPL